MSRLGRWLALALVLVIGLLAGGLWAVQHWVGSDDFRTRVASRASFALGVELKLGRVEVDWWPVPALALVEVDVQTRPHLTIARLEARPAVAGLLAGRLELATLLVRGADLPQTGVDDLLARREKEAKASATASSSQPAASDGAATGVVPQRLVLDGVTWRNAAGEATTVDADARLRPDGQPEVLTFKLLAGQFQGAQGRLERKLGGYEVNVEHGGGTIKGAFALDRSPAPGTEWSLKGQFDTAGVELGSLARTKLTGRLDAATTLSARAPGPGALLDALQTQSRFTVRNAVVHGVDLARAVKTVGLSRGGETRLDTLAGQVNTRGRAVTFSNLVASSGVLSATGNVTLSPSRALNGRVNVNLGASAVGDAIGVPLLVGGTVDAPELTLTRGAIVGAAVGTLLMPGVGTGAGASMGDKIGDKLKGLFGK